MDKPVTELVLQSVYSFRLWRNLFLTKLPQQIFVLMKTSWGRLEDIFRLRLQKSSKCLDQNEYIHLTHTSLEDVFKTSSGRLDQDLYIRLGHTSWRRLVNTSSKRPQDVFKTSCKNVFKTSSRCLQDVLNASSKRLQNVFKTSCQDVFKTSWETSSRGFEDVFKTSFKDIFKTFSRRWEGFNTFLRRSFPKTIIYRGICLDSTTSDKFMISVQICKRDKRDIFIFTTSFSGCLEKRI